MEPICECGHYPSQHKYVVFACKVQACDCGRYEGAST